MKRVLLAILLAVFGGVFLWTQGQTYVGGTDVLFEVTATDNVGVVRVNFFIDGVYYGMDIPDGDDLYDVTWDTTQFEDGPVILRAEAFDLAGNIGVSEPKTVTIDNNAPNVVIN